MKWVPHLLKLNPAGMDAPPPHGEVGLPARPALQKWSKLQGSGGQKKGDTLESSEIFHESYEPI